MNFPHYLLLFLSLLVLDPVTAQLVSPNQRYKIEYIESLPLETNVHFIDTESGKVIDTSISSGYEGEGYYETLWSPDSQYLAVISRGTKTTADIKIFWFDGSSVEEVKIPDYYLNLLGWRKLVEGGRHHWAKDLRWSKDKGANRLTFHCHGQWIDGAGDPAIDPDHWYYVYVTLSLYNTRADLKSITEAPRPEPDAFGE